MYEQARSSVSDLFSCPFHGRDGCAIGLPRCCAFAPAEVSPFFLWEKRAGFRAAAALPFPLVLPQQNGGHHRTSQPSGSPDGSAVRVCFSKLKKGLGSRARACSQIDFQTLFQLDCCASIRSQ
jgi:hypothetical protein